MPKKVNEAKELIPPKVVRETEELSCQLNELEWNTRAHELAEAHTKTEATKERKKSVMAELNADLKIAEAKETKLSNIVSTNHEQREVIVEVKYDYDKGTVTKTRTDTNEVISQREISDSERQSELDLVDANKFIEDRDKGEETEEKE